MTELELLVVMVAVAAVLSAALMAYLEHTSVKDDEQAHREVLKREPRYQEHRRRRR
jgi:type II secretory pathway pseudopilin PulG